jgi:hypothetical protein
MQCSPIVFSDLHVIMSVLKGQAQSNASSQAFVLMLDLAMLSVTLGNLL